MRQLKQGFSGDGKSLTGLIKAEKYGDNLAVEVSIINFAPLSVGEYYCLLSDSYGQVERLPLRGKCYFNLISRLNIDEGFCGVICFIQEDVVPIACGINGEKRYDFAKILSSAFPKEKRGKKPPILFDEEEEREGDEGEKSIPAPYESAIAAYDDEELCKENYYQKEGGDESGLSKKGGEDVSAQSRGEGEEEKARADLSKDVDDEDVRHPFTVDGRGYYDAVQDEIRTLFAAHPRDDTLTDAFSCSEWVRLKGEAGDAQYLVGVVYEELRPKYICYAIAAKEENPPQELGEACTFVPINAFDESRGYFVIFQSAATGECIKPKKC